MGFIGIINILEYLVGLIMMAAGLMLISCIAVFLLPGVPIFTEIYHWGTVFINTHIKSSFPAHWTALGIIIIGGFAETLLYNIRLIILQSLK